MHTIQNLLASALPPVSRMRPNAGLVDSQPEQTLEKHAPAMEVALGLPEAPLLVTTLKTGHNEDRQPVLCLLDNHERGQLYVLSEDSLRALLQMPEQEAAKAAWGLPYNQQTDASPKPATDTPLLH